MNLQSVQKIVLFGKPRAFSQEEFASQMQHHNIEIASEYSEDVTLLVDGRMMTPYEQNKSNELYETKSIESINIDVLEKALVDAMDDNVLLMSLKLSHDKERLKAFIQNTMISDALFFKLVKMYSWQGEDFFENDDNRDVSAAFISRFYENIERNHNVQYATTGFIHLVNQLKDAQILEAIADLEPMVYHPKILCAIALSSHITPKMQEKFYKMDTRVIHEALSLNKILIPALVQEFMEDEAFAKNVARSIELTQELFALLQKHTTSLASNESLDIGMQKELLALKDDTVNLSLASNSSLKQEMLTTLLEEANEELQEALHENSATPSSVLELAYNEGKHLAALAKNENTPVEILYQLQLDRRYERSVKTNAAFGKNIQSENIGWL